MECRSNVLPGTEDNSNSTDRDCTALRGLCPRAICMSLQASRQQPLSVKDNSSTHCRGLLTGAVSFKQTKGKGRQLRRAALQPHAAAMQVQCTCIADAGAYARTRLHQGESLPQTVRCLSSGCNSSSLTNSVRTCGNVCRHKEMLHTMFYLL